MDQSRRGDFFGSYLRIRVLLDVGRPLRRWLAVRLPDDSGTVEWVQLRYEKLPITCFLCGMLDHGEKECGLFTGKERADSDKPYGLWFQHDVLGPDYRKPKGRRFGLPSSGGWSMRAPMEVDDGETVGREGPVQEAGRADLDDHNGNANHALIAYSLGSGIQGADCYTEEETKSETLIPDLNGPPDFGVDLTADLVGPDLAGFVHTPHVDEFTGTQLTLGPLTRETNMGGPCVRVAGSGFGPSIPPLDQIYAAPTFGGGPKDLVNDDPFNLSPIIRRITAQDRVDRGKRVGRGCRMGPRRGGTGNSNGKRSLSMVQGMECMQVGKRPCLSSASSRSMMGSAEVGEAQPRRAP
ncbi:hypothetical protein CerSpe_078210 [Prunus speciosa]